MNSSSYHTSPSRLQILQYVVAWTRSASHNCQYGPATPGLIRVDCGQYQVARCGITTAAFGTPAGRWYSTAICARLSTVVCAITASRRMVTAKTFQNLLGAGI